MVEHARLPGDLQAPGHDRDCVLSAVGGGDGRSGVVLHIFDSYGDSPGQCACRLRRSEGEGGSIPGGSVIVILGVERLNGAGDGSSTRRCDGDIGRIHRVDLHVLAEIDVDLALVGADACYFGRSR